MLEKILWDYTDAFVQSAGQIVVGDWHGWNASFWSVF